MQLSLSAVFASNLYNYLVFTAARNLAVHQKKKIHSAGSIMLLLHIYGLD